MSKYILANLTKVVSKFRRTQVVEDERADAEKIAAAG